MRARSIHPTLLLAAYFGAAIAVGTCLLMLPWSSANGDSTNFVAALFTATSAVSITGLTVVDTATHWSRFGQVVILLLFQLGGLGVMTAATLFGLLMNQQLRTRSRLLLQAETRSIALGDVRSVVKLVLAITLTVELIISVVLTLRFAAGHGMPWSQAAWYGLFHGISAFNNAGFSVLPQGLVAFRSDAWVLLPMTVAILIGGIGFPVLHELRQLLQRRETGLSLHSLLTLWGSLGLLILGTVSFAWVERNNTATLGGLDAGVHALNALFMSVNTRSAGFNTVDIGALTPPSMSLTYLLMFIGGGSAGTAGGVKVATFMVILLIIWNEWRGHQDVEISRRRIAGTVQRQAITVVFTVAAVIVFATLLILPQVPGLPFQKVVFEVISAACTVGLSMGITSELPPTAQLILVVLMFLGRVGVVALAAALAFNQARRNYRYPEEKPIVG